MSAENDLRVAEFTVSKFPLGPDDCECGEVWGRCDDGSWRPRQYVYFAEFGPYVKVGHSFHPESRVQQIRDYGGGCARPEWHPYEARRFVPRIEPLRSVHVVEVLSPRIAERQAHHALADFRDVGEWFIAEPPLLAWISEQTAGRPFARLTRASGEWERPENAVEAAQFQLLRLAVLQLPSPIDPVRPTGTDHSGV